MNECFLSLVNPFECRWIFSNYELSNLYFQIYQMKRCFNMLKQSWSILVFDISLFYASIQIYLLPVFQFLHLSGFTLTRLKSVTRYNLIRYFNKTIWISTTIYFVTITLSVTVYTSAIMSLCIPKHVFWDLVWYQKSLCI